MRGVFVKIFLAFLVTSFIATGVTLVLAMYYRHWSNESANLIAPTAGYASAAELILQRGGEPLLLEWLLTFERHSSVNAYVFDDGGHSLLPNVPATVRDYALSSELYRMFVQPLDRSEILVKAPLQAHDGRLYLLVVEFIHPLAVFSLPTYLAWGFVASLLLFALWGILLSGYFTRPLRTLQASVAAFSRGQWQQIPLDLRQRDDEVGELSREFEHMAGKLQRVLADQRQLVRDVSHELRSPLARQIVALEMARLDALPEQEEFLDRIELETQRLDELIGDLLSMARLEVDQNHNHWQRLAAQPLLQAIIDDARFERPNASLELHWHAGEQALRGDARLLTAAFENLIRNALLHTDDGTSVEVSAQCQAQSLLLSVRDHGPGVPEYQLQDLLKPFVRHEDARQRSLESMDQGHRGFGLGLAIADKVIRHHSGQLVLRNHPDGGLQALVYLPLADGE